MPPKKEWIKDPHCRASANAARLRQDEIRIGDTLPPCTYEIGSRICGAVLEATATGLRNPQGGLRCLYLSTFADDLPDANEDEY